jgi:hypothetical protein
MAVVPVVQSCRRSGRVRLGFPPNSFVVARYRKDSKTQYPIDLMVGDKQKKLGEVVFNCWTRPSEGEEFTGYDVFKLNELEYPDYTKVKICDAYVKLDNGKGVSRPKWTRHRAKMFAGFEGNVQDGKKVNVPTYVCVPVNPDTLEDVAGASDVTVPAYRLRLTAWKPFTEAAPDYQAPFPEQRQSAKRKGVPRKPNSKRKKSRNNAKTQSHGTCDGNDITAVPRKAKSKLKRSRKNAKTQSHGTCDGDEVAAAAAAVTAAAYNDMLSKSAVVSTENKSSDSIVKNPDEFTAMVRGMANGPFGRALLPQIEAIMTTAREHHSRPSRSSSENLSVYTCVRQRGHNRVEIYVPTCIRGTKRLRGRLPPKNIRIPVQDNRHADNEAFIEFVTNYVTVETDSMSIPEKQKYVLGGFKWQELKNGQFKVNGHTLVDNIISSWDQTRTQEMVDQTCTQEIAGFEADTDTC